MSGAPLFLGATSSGDLDERYHEIVAAIRPVADIVEARPFSGLSLSLTLEMDSARLGELRDALGRAAAPLDAAAEAALAMALEGPGQTTVMLSVRFSEGCGDTKRVVPRVPG